MAAGMLTLRQDGWQRVLAGITTPEEVMKVTSSEEDAAETQEVSALNQDVLTLSLPRGVAISERRSFLRLNSQVNIRYKIFQSESQALKKDFTDERFSFTKDISAGGILFISHLAFVIGVILELTIKLPDASQPVECLARVVRIEESQEENKYEIAACFLDITSAQRVRLNKYAEKGKNS